MLALERFLADDVLLRLSNRVGSWLGDFDQVGMSGYQGHADTHQLDRKAAIMCYLSIFGWLVAYRMHKSQSTPMVSFHVRQMTFLHLLTTTCLLTQIALIPVYGWSSLALTPMGIAPLLLMRMLGVRTAMSGTQEPLPVVGRFAQWLLRDI